MAVIKYRSVSERGWPGGKTVDTASLKDFRRRVVGRRETAKRIQRGTAAAVFVARDADQAILTEIEGLCQTNGVPIHYIESMHELGQLCGIEVGAACAALSRGTN
jgi:large subunit ribosomal protein L7A